MAEEHAGTSSLSCMRNIYATRPSFPKSAATPAAPNPYLAPIWEPRVHAANAAHFSYENIDFSYESGRTQIRKCGLTPKECRIQQIRKRGHKPNGCRTEIPSKHD